MEKVQAYRDPEIAAGLIDRICSTSHRPMRIMEVCGTHTMSLHRNGIPSLMPSTVTLLSGPGCPVCVTSQEDIDAFINLTDVDDVILATFGDLLRVPGSHSSLLKQRAKGKDVRVVYSPLDALDLARCHPTRAVVFAGVGFETTAPLTAAAVLAAESQGLDNFFIYCSHKQVIPALTALLASAQTAVDGFLLPGHVSVIIGEDAYQSLVDRFQVPAVIAGFEPMDMLLAILLLVSQWEENRCLLENGYPRAVTEKGNTMAQSTMAQVYQSTDALWRGLGIIKESGFKFRDAYVRYDAGKVFTLPDSHRPEPSGCLCGEVLTGSKIPAQCGLYKKVCTPITPVGPCMVSSEGTCAAYYKYFA